MIFLLLFFSLPLVAQTITSVYPQDCGRADVFYSGAGTGTYTLSASTGGERLVEASKSAAYVQFLHPGPVSFSLNNGVQFPATIPPCRTDVISFPGRYLNPPANNTAFFSGSTLLVFPSMDQTTTQAVINDQLPITLPPVPSGFGVALGSNEQIYLWYPTPNGPEMDCYSPTGSFLNSFFAPGNSTTQVRQPITLPNGTIVAPFYSVPTGQPAFTFTFGLLWITNGSALVQYPITGPGVQLGTQMAIGQHPITGRLWVFYKNDSSLSLVATVIDPATRAVLSGPSIFLSFTTTSCTYYPDGTLNTCIGVGADGEFGPEGELPALHTASDSSYLYLAYQRENIHYIISPTWSGQFYFDYGPDHPQKTSRIGIAKIDGNGNKTLLDGPDWVFNLDEFGFGVQNGSLQLSYAPVLSDLSFNSVSYSAFVSGAWTPGIILGPRDQLLNPPAIVDGNAYLPMPDLSIHQISLAVPVPTPVIVFPTSVSLHRRQTQQFTANIPVSWSANPLIDGSSISQTGLYSAPNSIIHQQTLVTVTATDKSDPNNIGKAIVTLIP